MQFILEFSRKEMPLCWVRPEDDKSDICFINPKTKQALIFKNDDEALKALANENGWNFINGQQAYDELYKAFYHFGKLSE